MHSEYSKSQIELALQTYHQCKSVTKTVRTLGYPARESLYRWLYWEANNIEIKEKPKKKRKPRCYHPTLEFKMEILRRCFEQGEKVKPVSRECGYSRQIIYKWKEKYFKKEPPPPENDAQ